MSKTSANVPTGNWRINSVIQYTSTTKSQLDNNGYNNVCTMVLNNNLTVVAQVFVPNLLTSQIGFRDLSSNPSNTTIEEIGTVALFVGNNFISYQLCDGNLKIYNNGNEIIGQVTNTALNQVNNIQLSILDTDFGKANILSICGVSTGCTVGNCEGGGASSQIIKPSNTALIVGIFVGVMIIVAVGFIVGVIVFNNRSKNNNPKPIKSNTINKSQIKPKSQTSSIQSPRKSSQLDKSQIKSKSQTTKQVKRTTSLQKFI